MSKKLYGLLLPILATAAFASMSAAAQAAPHWAICEPSATGKWATSLCSNGPAGTEWEWLRPANGVSRRVVTFGEVTLTASNGLVVKCSVLDRGKIENQAAGGVDSVALFENYECESVPATSCPTGVTVTATGLPWASKLVTGPLDKIEGIKVTVNCSGTIVELAGELSPAIAAGVAEFSAGSGKLENAAKTISATVSGNDNIRTTSGQLVRAE